MPSTMKNAALSGSYILLAGACLGDPSSIGAWSDDDGGGSTSTSTPTSTATTSVGSGPVDSGAVSNEGTATGSGETADPEDCTPAAAILPSPYIWIPRGDDGVMLKYDIETMDEVGRYAMRPYGASDGSRSRVSVNLSGDVVVSNRLGGVSMFFAREADCVERNGTAGIQTSSGAGDLLDWDDEECRGWYAELEANSQRVLAWTAGTLDRTACRYVSPEVWTSRLQWNGVVQVFLLDGNDGTELALVDVPEMDPQGDQYGAYGGAVDRDGDLWMASKQDDVPGDLCEITHDALDARCWGIPATVLSYGFTLDDLDRPWVAGNDGSVARFDPLRETWQVELTGAPVSGIQQAADRRMWLGALDPPGLLVLDPDSMQVLQSVPIAPGAGLRGISVDALGQVWGLSTGSRIIRYDPASGELIQQTDVFPYVHSSDNAGTLLARTVLGG